MRRLSLIVSAAALLTIAAGPSLAAENAQEVNQILQLYQQQAQAWQSTRSSPSPKPCSGSWLPSKSR